MHKLVNFYKGYHFVKYHTNTICIYFVKLMLWFLLFIVSQKIFCVYFVTNDIYKKNIYLRGFILFNLRVFLS